MDHRGRYFLPALLLAAAAGCGTGTEAIRGEPSADPTSPSAVPESSECMRDGDGALITETGGVTAREGECLTSRAVAYAPGAVGETTPEGAIRQDGLGRGALAARDPESTAHQTWEETEGGRTVGLYGVFRLPDGTWVVDNYLASVSGG